jgi:CheY-like chemotaxis protein
LVSFQNNVLPVNKYILSPLESASLRGYERQDVPSAMKPELRILLLEDNDADANLIVHELEACGFSFRLSQIQTEAELRREMEAETPDVVLSDDGLPSFDGFKALHIVHKSHPQVPFIFVSGSNDPGMVAEMYEEGATDYVFKRDVGDLKTAVIQALEAQTETTTLGGVEGIAAQPEPELHYPVTSPPRAASSPVVGHVSFCPQCRQSQDDKGQPIQLENYCGSHAEVVIIRHLCAQCDDPVRST